MKRVLIIEDDKSIADIERDFLQINGFEVAIVPEGNAGLEEALSGNFDLILLDLMLPGINGFEICRRIRQKKDIPILMVTSKIEEIDRIHGLGLGADDYILKPFSPTELVARVKANLAQYERIKAGPGSGDTDEISAGSIRINPKSRRVYAYEKEVDLKNKEYELLYFLMTNPEIVFSKETIYDRIWGAGMYGDIKTVAVHINRIREKIERDPANPVHIETVWGAGYRFKA